MSSHGLFQTPYMVAVELVPVRNDLQMMASMISCWHHVLLAATTACEYGAERK